MLKNKFKVYQFSANDLMWQLSYCLKLIKKLLRMEIKRKHL